MTVKNIVFVFADSAEEWNTSEWRSRTPSDALNASGKYTGRCVPMADFMQYGHPSVQEVVGPADAIVVQRNLLSKEVWDACDYWRGIGKLVLADLDDDYPHLLPQNPAYHFWILDKAELKKTSGYTPIEALTEGFRHVDGLLSPNDLILEDWAHIVPGYWLPNYARWEWYKGIKQKPLPQEDVIIGWGGSVSHFDGWWFSGLREAVPVITERYPRVTWKICGGDRRVKRLIDQLTGGRLIDQEGVPPELWPRQVASFDMGLAPLCGSGSPQAESYDNHRSWLKAVEYALTGVPWVASEGVVYERLNGRGGFTVANTTEGWVDGISQILDNLGAYKARSKKLMSWARDNLTIERMVDSYVNVFNTAMADRNAGHGARIPNVLHATDFFDSTDEVKSSEISWSDDGEMDELAEIQARALDAVQSWLKEAELDYGGVDVGRCLEYPMLHDLNHRVYREVTSG